MVVRDPHGRPRRRRLRTAAGAVVAGTVFLVHGGGPVPREHAAPLRVMTFNLRYAAAADGPNAWPARRDLLFGTIARFGPGLLGTQECLESQARELGVRFPRFEMVGAGRDDGRSGEMAAIFYDGRQFTREDAGHFWLSEAPSVPGSRGWDAGAPRIVSWARLRTRDRDAVAFCFANTHFDNVGAQARDASARLLRERISALCPGLPVVVTGDFNAPADPDAPGPYRRLVGEAGAPFRDAFRVAHPTDAGNEGTFHGFSGIAGGERIDWILVSPGIAVTTAEIDRRRDGTRYPSDHYPVEAVLVLPK